MEACMSWGTKPNDHEMTRDAESWVSETYTDYRNRGHNAPVALEQTALSFGVTRRRARSFLEGYASSIIADEWRELKRRFMAHLDAEAAYAMKRSADRLARLDKMRRDRDETREMRR